MSTTRAPMPNLVGSSMDKTDGYGGDLKAEWHKRKESARGSVIKLFKNVAGTEKVKKAPEQDDGSSSPRPAARKAKARRFDISDDVLDRLVLYPGSQAKMPSDDFLAKQKRRARAPTGTPQESDTSLPLSRKGRGRQYLDAEDIIYMFAGAPYFDVDIDGLHLEPKVVLGWGPSVSTHQLQTDWTAFKHRSFYVCTTDSTSKAGTMPSRRRRRGHPRERPSMLTGNGRDAGSIGFSHYLESPLGSGTPPNYHLATANQQHLLSSPEMLGLRHFDIENALDRLSELSTVYDALSTGQGDAADWNSHMIEAIGEDLFSTLLDVDLGDDGSTVPRSTSLREQIAALQTVFLTEYLWFDFSQESWRSQFGRLLWEPSVVEMTQGYWLSERDVLVFQVALAAELAVRMELAVRIADSGKSNSILALGDIEAILESQTEVLDWHIVAFHRFTQCFSISARHRSTNEPLRRLSVIAGASQASRAFPLMAEQEPDLVLTLRQEAEQWTGLQTFATELNWPDVSAMKQQPLPKFDSLLTTPAEPIQCGSYGSEYGTPMSTPRSSRIPDVQQTPAMVFSRSEKALTLHPALSDLHGGDVPPSWETLSWLSGSILPGSSMSSLLMQTLLEVTPDAHRLVTDVAEMHDGFVYKQQMYWNKQSVVGRVLAPTPGAAECVGWFSLPFVPQDQGEGHVQPYVLTAPYSSLEPRLYSHGLVAASSDPLRGIDASQLYVDDFTTILDGHKMTGNEAQLEGVALTDATVRQDTDEGFELPKLVSLSFRSPHSRSVPSLSLPLVHDVQFVSSYPCHPVAYSKHQAGQQGVSPGGSASAISGDSSPSPWAHNRILPQPPAHPLHVGYTYIIIPAAALLSSELPEVKNSDTLLLLDPTGSDKPAVYHIADQEVVVLDCRGNHELEVLARAWCSKVGEHALIGKSGRTCLACCIREAVSLGIGVVLRTS